MSQARDAAVTEALEDLADAIPGATPALVSRSGSLIAGRSPAAVTRETYAAMLAVTYGAAEAGTADLGDEVASVEVRLKTGAAVCVPVGRKMLLVVHVPSAAALEGARAKLQEAALRLAALY